MCLTSKLTLTIYVRWCIFPLRVDAQNLSRRVFPAHGQVDSQYFNSSVLAPESVRALLAEGLEQALAGPNLIHLPWWMPRAFETWTCISCVAVFHSC